MLINDFVPRLQVDARVPPYWVDARVPHRRVDARAPPYRVHARVPHHQVNTRSIIGVTSCSMLVIRCWATLSLMLSLLFQPLRRVANLAPAPPPLPMCVSVRS